MGCSGESGRAEVAGERPVVGDVRVSRRCVVAGGAHLRNDPVSSKFSYIIGRF